MPARPGRAGVPDSDSAARAEPSDVSAPPTRHGRGKRDDERLRLVVAPRTPEPGTKRDGGADEQPSGPSGAEPERGRRRGPSAGLRGQPQRDVWVRSYCRSLVVADATAAALLAAGAALLLGEPVDPGPYVLVLLLPLTWVSAVLLVRGYEPRFLGVGSEEYRRVAVAALTVATLLGTGVWALEADLNRAVVVPLVPLLAVVTLVGRYTFRTRLHRRRARGECLQRVVAVGHPAGVAELVRRVRTAPYHGMAVVGACVVEGSDEVPLHELDVPVLGGLGEVLDVVECVDADIVAVVTCPEVDGPALRQLGWELETTRADLVVVSALMEVVGPRIAIRPVCGIPLLHIQRPELTGVRRGAKRAMDVAVASVALVLLLPLLIAIALAVRLDSRGPAFFRQDRVGRDGRTFPLLKYRTMVVGAERELPLLRDADEGNGVLFKMRADPRVTRVGRLLRRYSLDELPQLVNVLLGQMSLVGPRPPLPKEAAAYGEDMRRRLLVRPGLTGLWQINGRSDLSWEESVRLDVRYVENWSFAFDLMILWKTWGAVVRGSGAY